MAVCFSNHNALYLIERDHIGRPVIELCRARTLVRGHGLGVLERAAGLEVGRDAGGAKSVTANFGLEARVGRTPPDHAPDIDAVHRQAGEDAGLADSRSEEGSS